MIRIILVAAALFCGVMTVAANIASGHRSPVEVEGDLFAPELSRITSVDEAEQWIRERLPEDPSDADSAEAIARFMRLRFVHDLAEFKFSDDWIAYLAGYLWRDLRAPVRADDLLKFRRGICSQQTIVFQALLERFGIDYATIRFDNPPHMLVGARIGEEWAVYDSDKEPRRSRIVPWSEIQQGDVLVELYGGMPGTASYGFGNDVGKQWRKAATEGRMVLENPNEHPAPQGVLFHTATGLLSQWGWLLFGGAALLSLRLAPAGSRRRSNAGAAAEDGPALADR